MSPPSWRIDGLRMDDGWRMMETGWRVAAEELRGGLGGRARESRCPILAK